MAANLWTLGFIAARPARQRFPAFKSNLDAAI